MLVFDLDEPIHCKIGLTATKCWFNIIYPQGDSHVALWTEDTVTAWLGTYKFPQEVIDRWIDSDQVLIDHMKQAKPWEGQV